MNQCETSAFSSVAAQCWELASCFRQDLAEDHKKNQSEANSLYNRCSLMLLCAFQICSLVQWQFIAMKLNLQSNRFSFRATALTYLAVCTTVTREHGGRSAKVREFLSALGILSLRSRHSHTKIDSIHKKALWPSDI